MSSQTSYRVYTLTMLEDNIYLHPVYVYIYIKKMPGKITHQILIAMTLKNGDRNRELWSTCKLSFNTLYVLLDFLQL